MIHFPRRHSRRQLPPIVCACLMAAAASPGQTGESGHVTAVRYWSLGDVTRIAIETDGDFEFRSDRLQNPDRLFFDIVGARPRLGQKVVKVIPVSDRFIRQIRVAESQRDVTRVVLDLESQLEFTTSRLDNPERLIVELHAPGYARAPGKPESIRMPEVALLDTPPVVEPSMARPIATPGMPVRLPGPPVMVRTRPDVLAKSAAQVSVSTPLMVSTSPGIHASSEPAVVARRNSTGDRSMARALGLKLGRIVLDAGHGGHDTGTIGPNGLNEKDLVLDVTRRLGALIVEKMGNEVIYTRSDDTFVPLERRTEIANTAKADLFLSIHANSSPLQSTTGVETYYLSFTTSKTALDVAARENASSEKSIYELQDLLQKIALKDKVDESREFAARVQDALFAVTAKNNGKARDRGIRKAPFVVLIGASMPSVLAEIGFISNAHDENLMKRAEQRQRIAEALYKGLSSYAATLSHFQVAQRR